MATKPIGFASQYTNGVWGPIFPTLELATRWMREHRDELDPARLVMPILADVPDGTPRPTVLLTSGERVRYNLNRREFVVVLNGVNDPFTAIVDMVRKYNVTDAELDALQALPAQTAAWAAAGGRD